MDVETLHAGLSHAVLTRCNVSTLQRLYGLMNVLAIRIGIASSHPARIRAATAVDLVRAAAAQDAIIAAQTVDDVITRAANDQVIAVRAGDVARSPDDIRQVLGAPVWPEIVGGHTAGDVTNIGGWDRNISSESGEGADQDQGK